LMKWIMMENPFYNMTLGRDHVFYSQEMNPFIEVNGRYIGNFNFQRKGPMMITPETDMSGGAQMGSGDKWRKHREYDDFLLYERQMMVPYDVNDRTFIAEPHWSLQLPKKYLIQFFGSIARGPQAQYIRNTMVAHMNRSSEDISVNLFSIGAFIPSSKDKAEGEKVKAAIADELHTTMRQSVFCLAPLGDSSTAKRLFNAILAGCIPVLISDAAPLPFYNYLNYDEFMVRVHEYDVHRLESILRAIPADVVAAKQKRLMEVRPYFVFPYDYAAESKMMELLFKELEVRAIQMSEWKNFVLWNNRPYQNSLKQQNEVLH